MSTREMLIDSLRARIAELEVVLTALLTAFADVHSEDCHANGATDEEVEAGSGKSPDPACDCGALRARNKARALAKGKP